MLRGCLFVGMLSGWALSASALYVVRSPKGVSVFTKDSLSFVDTYADTRTWKTDDLASHKEIVSRMKATGRDDLLPRGESAKEANADSGDSKHHKRHSHHTDVAMGE